MPITIQALAEGFGDVTISYLGNEVHIKYRLSAVTKQFRAESLRMGREGLRIQRRIEEMKRKIETIEAPDGSPEAAEEDAEAEKAIEQIQADDKLLKAAMDKLLCAVAVSWDVFGTDGKMLPLDAENLAPLPADFIAVIIQAIVAATVQGEAKPVTSTSD